MKLDPATVLTAVPERAGLAETRFLKYRFAPVMAVIAWLLFWYWDTARAMVAIWERSETFAHGYVIVPISAWLIWRRRRELAALDMRPNFWVMPLLAIAGFGWMLGQLAGVGVVQQYCMVIMIPLLVWSILGNQCARALAFPLFFLVLAVPFGEFLYPLLMDQTADFTVLALRLSGIPVYREGLFFSLPTGNWSVVEACSGLRYLIASLTLGFLYAYLTYRSLVKRTIFIMASIIVPIVANWLRAYMIVMIGHFSQMKYAVGVDHLLYGWIFFGVVMLALFWGGSHWRDDHPAHSTEPGLGTQSQHSQPSLSAVVVATVSAAIVVMTWPAVASYLERPDPHTPVLIAPSGAWKAVPQAVDVWQPRFGNPRTELTQDYVDGANRATLYIGYYRNQRHTAEMISSQNALVDKKGDWRLVEESRRSVDIESERIALIESKLRRRSTDLLVWQWYWIDGQYTANDYIAKLLQAKSKLLGHGDDGAVVVLYTNLDPDQGAAAARLREFAIAMLPAITASLQHAR